MLLPFAARFLGDWLLPCLWGLPRRCLGWRRRRQQRRRRLVDVERAGALALTPSPARMRTEHNPAHPAPPSSPEYVGRASSAVHDRGYLSLQPAEDGDEEAPADGRAASSGGAGVTETHVEQVVLVRGEGPVWMQGEVGRGEPPWSLPYALGPRVS